jgi:hypothetical protein
MKGALAIVHEAVDNVFNRIVVCGELSRPFALAFEGMERKAGQTVLMGEVIDCIGGLGLELVSGQPHPENTEQAGSTGGDSVRRSL